MSGCCQNGCWIRGEDVVAKEDQDGDDDGDDDYSPEEEDIDDLGNKSEEEEEEETVPTRTTKQTANAAPKMKLSKAASKAKKPRKPSAARVALEREKTARSEAAETRCIEFAAAQVEGSRAHAAAHKRLEAGR
ncbi:hypothetical protein PI124_g16221 [Phytophthora idaei]|nr:hypothetical protein PI125_g16607 [Phytophthora idaei]KAG3149846.1 hypothetical protein PI126_g11824 [Phytophthora idaei]KAG3238830.1 hypothetical protein PI124_g16221 [Phytophthora idaei]